MPCLALFASVRGIGSVVRLASARVLVLLLALGASAARGEEAFGPAIFAQGELVRVELPLREIGQTPRPSSGTLALGAARPWLLADDRAKEIRRGQIRPDERALHFADLPPGGYFLCMDAASDSIGSAIPLPAGCPSFIVRSGRGPLPEDHFFAANQPDMAQEVRAGRTGPGSDYAFAFAAMKALGIRRLRTRFSSDLVQGQDGGPDWQGLDALVQDASEAGIRFITVLDVESAVFPSSSAPSAPSASPAPPADHAEALLRRYGFALDEFALCGRVDLDSSGKLPPPDLPDRIGSAYAVLKHRSPRCAAALGDLTFSPLANARTKVFLGETASVCDVLDYRADGSYADFRRATEVLDRLVQGTEWEKKYRAVSRAGSGRPPSEANIASQRSQASETIKKLAWARYAGYRYFAAGRLVDSPPGRRQGSPLDDLAGTGLFSNTPGGGREAGAPRSPRLVAGAWVHALVRLGGSRPAAKLGFRDSAVEIYGFERTDETILVAWTPSETKTETSSEGLDASDNRTVLSLFWPEEASGEAYDLMGRKATADRLRKKGGRERYFLVDSEPVYLAIPAPAEKVSW